MREYREYRLSDQQKTMLEFLAGYESVSGSRTWRAPDTYSSWPPGTSWQALYALRNKGLVDNVARLGTDFFTITIYGIELCELWALTEGLTRLLKTEEGQADLKEALDTAARSVRQMKADSRPSPEMLEWRADL